MYASKLYPSHEKRAIRLENKTLPPNNSKELYHTRPRIILENDQTSLLKKKRREEEKKNAHTSHQTRMKPSFEQTTP